SHTVQLSRTKEYTRHPQKGSVSGGTSPSLCALSPLVFHCPNMLITHLLELTVNLPVFAPGGPNSWRGCAGVTHPRRAGESIIISAMSPMSGLPCRTRTACHFCHTRQQNSRPIDRSSRCSCINAWCGVF